MTRFLVSGQSVQIKDTNGYESDGLNECLLLCLLVRMPVTDGISLGICAMDYRGDELYQTGNTRGLIVDDVSHSEQPDIILPISFFDSSGYA